MKEAHHYREVVSWFNPSQQLSPTQPLAHSPQWNGGENRKSKNEKTRGLRERQSNRYSKSRAHKQSKTRNSFTTSHRQAGVQPSPGKQGSITPNAYLGRQMPSLRTSPPSFFFPQLYMLSMTSYGMEYPFGHLGSAVPAVSQFLVHPQPTRWWGGVRSRKGLDSV